MLGSTDRHVRQVNSRFTHVARSQRQWLNINHFYILCYNSIIMTETVQSYSDPFQKKLVVRKNIGKHTKTEGGVCNTQSARWQLC